MKRLILFTMTDSSVVPHWSIQTSPVYLNTRTLSDRDDSTSLTIPPDRDAPIVLTAEIDIAFKEMSLVLIEVATNSASVLFDNNGTCGSIVAIPAFLVFNRNNNMCITASCGAPDVSTWKVPET